MEFRLQSVERTASKRNVRCLWRCVFVAELEVLGHNIHQQHKEGNYQWCSAENPPLHSIVSLLTVHKASDLGVVVHLLHTLHARDFDLLLAVSVVLWLQAYNVEVEDVEPRNEFLVTRWPPQLHIEGQVGHDLLGVSFGVVNSSHLQETKAYLQLVDYRRWRWRRCVHKEWIGGVWISCGPVLIELADVVSLSLVLLTVGHAEVLRVSHTSHWASWIMSSPLLSTSQNWKINATITISVKKMKAARAPPWL